MWLLRLWVAFMSFLLILNTVGRYKVLFWVIILLLLLCRTSDQLHCDLVQHLLLQVQMGLCDLTGTWSVYRLIILQILLRNGRAILAYLQKGKVLCFLIIEFVSFMFRSSCFGRVLRRLTRRVTQSYDMNSLSFYVTANWKIALFTFCYAHWDVT